MKATVLERLFITERKRQRIAGDATLATPGIHERIARAEATPFVVSNARSTFVQTRRRSDGVVRSGFSECPLAAEGALLTELYRGLWTLGQEHGWDNRFPTLTQARERMAEPRLVVVSDALLREVGGGDLTPEDVEQLMLTRGYVLEADGLKVLAGGLASGAMLAAAPSSTGFYTRTGDWLSIFVQRANRAILLVGDDVG